MPHLTIPVDEKDHREGPDEAPVTLVEYGDFECPTCKEAYPVVKQIKQELGDQVRIVYRHYPLSNIHPHARQAAAAAEAAAVQGKFWEYHDALFTHQDNLEDTHLVEYARTLGLNVEQFERELSGHVYDNEVWEDFMSGTRSGVNGTPTFFIDGERYDDPWGGGNLLHALEDKITVELEGSHK
jgi:formate-nitrite transporter family protein